MDTRTFVRKVGNRLARVESRARYEVERLQHRSKRPHLSDSHRKIVEEIEQEGVCIRTLAGLGVPCTPAFVQAFEPLVRDLEGSTLGANGNQQAGKLEYGYGFEHCVPVNPSRIAQAYPALYLWGLDEVILDIVENCIGLPVTYHGVLARREINDGKQIGSRLWHNDAEDRIIIRVNTYVTDVRVEDGPFEYVPKPISPPHGTFSSMVDDAAVAKVVPREFWKACPGPAHTVIIAATSQVLHHGKVPTSDRRRIAVSHYYTSRHPTCEELCRAFSFAPGLPYIKAPLSKRQREALP
jgi:hypothetical protein